MNCGGYLFKLAPVTAGPGRAEPGFALKGTRPGARPRSPWLASEPGWGGGGAAGLGVGGCGGSSSQGQWDRCRLTSEVLLTSAFHEYLCVPKSWVVG